MTPGPGLRDDTGAAVPVPARVSRVVSLVPSLTETVAALVAGATDWCTHPAGLDVSARTTWGRSEMTASRSGVLVPHPGGRCYRTASEQSSITRSSAYNWFGAGLGPILPGTNHVRPGSAEELASVCNHGQRESTMPRTRSRYDGHAEWYDSWNTPGAKRNASDVRDLLGPGAGLCLDLGCGGGLYFDVLAATGRTVVGLDGSADQLRIARERSRQIVLGDAVSLPFADCTFPAVATMWISTDVDDFAAVLAEAARVLTPGGLLVFYGAHPCFNGPHSQWMDDGGVLAHPTYRLAGWHQESPWWGVNVRRRVGMRHHPLADLLNAFIATGLVIERVAEPGDRPLPVSLAIRAHKPAVTPSPAVTA